MEIPMPVIKPREWNYDKAKYERALQGSYKNSTELKTHFRGFVKDIELLTSATLSEITIKLSKMRAELKTDDKIVIVKYIEMSECFNLETPGETKWIHSDCFSIFVKDTNVSYIFDAYDVKNKNYIYTLKQIS